MGKIEPQPGIMNIALYQSGAAHVPGVDNVIKLSSNENPYGPSPKAVEAVRNAAAQMHRYPNTDHTSLRAAIGEAHDMDPDRIICGVGSDEIIHFLCQAYAGPGDEVLHTEHGFSMYKISAMAAGATPVEVKERERVTDVDALLAGCTERTRLVFIANPNNPTGSYLGDDEMKRLVEGVPENVLLVIDAAYAEYVARNDYTNATQLVDAHPNVVMTRTFSKIHGLAALRLGWCYAGSEVTELMNRIRGPFNVGSPALAHAPHRMLKKVLPLRHLLRKLPALPYAGASFLLAPIMPLFKNTAGWLFGNPANLGTVDMMKLVCMVPSNLPTVLIAQFGDWLAERGFAGADGHLTYYDELHRVEVPTLLLAGEKDYLTPPSEIRYVYDNLGSKDKTLLNFDKSMGVRHEYGHIDLILGKFAKEEVWPHMHAFLAAH